MVQTYVMLSTINTVKNKASLVQAYTCTVAAFAILCSWNVFTDHCTAVHCRFFLGLVEGLVNTFFNILRFRARLGALHVYLNIPQERCHSKDRKKWYKEHVQNEQNTEERNDLVLLHLDSVMTTSKFYLEYQTAKLENYLNRNDSQSEQAVSDKIQGIINYPHVKKVHSGHLELSRIASIPNNALLSKTAEILIIQFTPFVSATMDCIEE
uniref:Uncharacterized protein n=1 Tax=Glossina austeni TaxID=7395 RepID=A0A1A9UMQ1_GLOAU